MSKFIISISHIHNFKEYKMSAHSLRALLKESKSSLSTYLWDNLFYYVSLEDWGKIFDRVLTGMPRYVAEKFDCENFGMLTAARVAEKYKLNTCGLCIGGSPYGNHGYNLFVSMIDDKPAVMILEPQTGVVYSLDEPSGYNPQIVYLG